MHPVGSFTCDRPGAQHAGGQCSCRNTFSRRLPPQVSVLSWPDSPRSAWSPHVALPLGSPLSAGEDPVRTWSPHVALPLGSPLGPASPMRLQDDDTANASMFAAIPITPRARQPKRLGLGPPEGTPPEHAMQQQSPGLEQVAAHTPAAHQGPLVHQLASALKSPSCTFQRSASLRSHDGVAGEEALQTEVEVLRLDMCECERC